MEDSLLGLMGSSWIERLAFVLSIIYVLLAARENIWCWLFGLLSVILYSWVFLKARLYSDASLQVYYVGMSIYGWWQWRQQAQSSWESQAEAAAEGQAGGAGIRVWPLRRHLLFILLGFALTFPLGYFWTFFGASLPYFDAFTTSFAILTTFLVARKVLENWLYWIVIDLTCVGVYLYKDLQLTALLFLIYTIIAVFGFFQWRKKWQSSAG